VLYGLQGLTAVLCAIARVGRKLPSTIPISERKAGMLDNIWRIQKDGYDLSIFLPGVPVRSANCGGYECFDELSYSKRLL
jgi:hypothetical protein